MQCYGHWPFAERDHISRYATNHFCDTHQQPIWSFCVRKWPVMYFKSSLHFDFTHQPIWSSQFGRARGINFRVFLGSWMLLYSSQYLTLSFNRGKWNTSLVGKKGLEENNLFVLPESILTICYINYATVLRKCSIVLPNPRLVFSSKRPWWLWTGS